MQKQRIGILSLVAATYFIVAGGPFGLEDIVSKAGYSGAILILLITPLIWSLPTALMVSEMTSAVPEEGGYYVYVSRAMGPFWGFQEVWLSLIGSVFDMAIYPTLFIGYLGHFAPWMTTGWRGPAIGVALIATCALWNVLGVRAVGRSAVAMGFILLAPFAVLAAYAGWHHASGGGASTPLRGVDLLGGILVAMWNYMGWDNTSTIAGEVERPQRTYPVAMAAAVALVAVSYVLPIAAVAATKLDPNAWSTGGWADVARAVFHHNLPGEVLAAAITVGGLMGAAGSLNTLTLTLSRLPAVLADDGYLPGVLSRRHPRTGAPWVALAACAAGWAACLGFSFVKLIVLDVLLTGLSIVLQFVALVALRIREPELKRPYRVPGGLAGAVAIGIPPAALLLLAVVRNEVEPVGPINALVFGLILIVVGAPLYWWRAWKRRALG